MTDSTSSPGVSSADSSQKSLFRRFNDFLFGYDYFISYAWADGRTYAAQLAEELEKRRLECFLDSDDYAKGDNWKLVGQRALQKTSRLILVGSPRALESKPVLREVEIYTSGGRHVIPISFDGSLDPDRTSSPLLKYIAPEVLRIEQRLRSLASGPSDEIVDGLVSTFRILTQEQKRTRFFAAAATLFALVAIAAVVGFVRATISESKAVAAQADAYSQLANANWQRAFTARDFEDHRVKAAHFFLLASQAARMAGDESSARNALFFRRPVMHTYPHDGPVDKALILPHSRRLLTLVDDAVTIWEIDTRSRAAVFEHDESIIGASFSRDESSILTWGWDATARIWSVDERVGIATFRHAVPHETQLSEWSRQAVYGARFNADESQVLTWSVDGTVRLWDVASQSELRRYEHDEAVYGAAFSPDGSMILSWSRDGTARLSSTHEQRTVATLWHHPPNEGPPDGNEWRQSVEGAMYVNNGTNVVTWGADGFVKLWDVKTQSEICSFQCGEVVRGAEATPNDAQLLCWTADGEIVVCNLDDGARVMTVQHGGSEVTQPVIGATFSRDGSQVLSWSDDGTTRIWEVATQRELVMFQSAGAVIQASFSNDESRVLTASQDGTARIWDIDAKRSIETFSHDGWVNGAAFIGDESEVVTWSRDGTVRIWSVEPENVATVRHEGDRFSRVVTGACFNRDETRVLTWGADGTSRVVDIATNTNIAMFDHPAAVPHLKTVQGAQFCGDGDRVLTWSRNGAATIWNVETQASIAAFQHRDGVQDAAFNADESRLLTSSWDGTAKLWDVQSEKLIAEFKHGDTQSEGVHQAIFDPDESHVLTLCQDQVVRLWSVREQRVVASFDHSDTGSDIKGMSFSPSGFRVLTWGGDGTARIWEIEEQQLSGLFLHEHSATRMPDPLNGAAFSRDETRLVTWGHDGTARIWNIEGQALVAVFEHERVEYESAVDGATFNDDESLLLTWSRNGRAIVWDVQEQRAVATFVHEGWVNGAVFSDDESRVLTWSDDGTARLCDIKQQQAVATLVHGAGVLGATFSHNESLVLTWSEDGSAKVWDLSIDETTPIDRQILDWEIESATTIDDNTGRYRPLNHDEWLKRSRRVADWQ